MNTGGYYICIGVCREGRDEMKMQKKGKIGAIMKDNEISVLNPFRLIPLYENAHEHIQTYMLTNTNTHIYDLF